MNRTAAAAFAAIFLLNASAPAFAQPAPAPAAAAAPVTAAEYRLGAGDVIRITVYQNPDLTLEARVGENNQVSYPLLGSVALGGMSVSQAEKSVADKLRTGNFVKQPQVSILVLQVRGNQVSVLGQVAKPGRFPIETAEMRVSEMIANAGGALPTGADLITIVGTRNGQPFRKEIDLPGMFRTPNRADDILLQNGDVVYVERGPIVYIYGEVQRPGAMRLERNMSVLQALATGGGLTLRGTEKGIRVHRRDADGKLEVMPSTMDMQLKDGDVVYVRESLF